MEGAGRQSRSRTGYVRSPWFRMLVRAGQIVADAVMLYLAFWLAYEVRYDWQLGGPVKPADFEPFSTFQSRAFFFVGFAIVIFVVRGLYRLPRSTALLDEMTLVASGVTTAMAGV